MRLLWFFLAVFQWPFWALCQTPIPAWEGDTALWELTPFSATLNAPGPGLASIGRCFLPPDSVPLGLDLRWRWIQNLAGSNANHSSIRLYTDSLTVLEIGLGTTGSEDPLEIHHLQNDSMEYTALQHGTWALGMDAEFRWLQPPGSSQGTAYIRAWNSSTYTPLTFASGQPSCLSLTAEFTSSNTQNFALHLEPSVAYVPDTIAPFITSAIWHSDTLLSLTFSEPLVGLPTCHWPALEGALCHFPETSAIQRDCLHCLPPLTGVPPGIPFNWSAIDVVDTCGNIADPILISTYAFPLDHVIPGQIQITEIMADPTPSQGLPEMEWVELTNFGSSSVQISSLVWQESSGVSNLVPLRGWDGRLDPEGRCILSVDTTPLLEGLLQAHLPEGGALLDGGERIAILREDGLLIDAVSYDRTWWQGAPGGTSVGLQVRGACGLASNWSPEFPASPGYGNEAPEKTDALEIAGIWPIHIASGRVQFTNEIAPERIGSIQWHGACAFALIPDSPNGARWEGIPPEGATCFTIRGIASCEAPWEETRTLSLSDSILSFPGPGELVLSEIAVQSPSGWPGLPPFVELTNTTSKTLEIGGVTVNNRACAQRQLDPNGSVVLVIDLPNTQGEILLEDGKGQVLEQLWYSACWHQDRSLESKGVSLERLDLEGPASDARNWVSSTSPLGCSPGWVNEQVLWMDDAAPVATAFVALSNAMCIWFSEPVTPVNQLAFESVNPFEVGMDLGQCWCWDETPLPAQFIDFSGNGCSISPPDSVSDTACFMLNECFSWVRSNEEPFIEVLGKGSGWSSTADWIWSSSELPFGSDWLPLSQAEWIIPLDDETAWARCPQRLIGGVVLPTAIPSLHGDHLITLGKLNSGLPLVKDTLWSSRDRFDPHHRLVQGTSWERFHERLGAWAPCLNHSTPGLTNSQHSDAGTSLETLFNVSPKTCIPFDADWGQLSIQYTPDDSADLARLWVADAQGNCIKMISNEYDAKPAEGSWVWFWNGLSNSGIPAQPGGYWIIAEGSDAHIINAIPVVVGPPRD